MIDIDFKTSLKPKSGSLLIAEPFADDDYFRRSVVLLCDHNDKGSFGFVLNNYLDLSFNDLSDENLEFNSRISIGGPVDTKNLYYIHYYGDLVPDSVKVMDDLYLGGDFKSLVALLQQEAHPEMKARFFLGYSGWTENQLNHEIQSKFWVVVDTELESDLMDTSNQDLWSECLNKLGGKYKMFTHFPLNPSNN